MNRNSPDVEIREALPEDADSIVAVLHQAFVEYESLYTAGGFSATALSAEKVLERMREGPMWVALSEGRTVGTASALETGEGLYIRGMAVVPQARGLRIGELLLLGLEAFAANAGCKKLILSTTPSLARAIRLYQKAGFQRVDEGPDNLVGTPLFTMTKLLE